MNICFMPGCDISKNIDLSVSAVHSLSVCPSNAMEGTMNSTKPLSDVSRSAIFRAVKVLLDVANSKLLLSHEIPQYDYFVIHKGDSLK